MADLGSVHTVKKIVIQMMIPVKKGANDDFLARVYANLNHER